MTQLLPPNASRLEQAIAQATARLTDIDANLRKVWRPADCPPDLLPWLAWALSLDSWATDWPDNVKRDRVRKAISIARNKGTADSVRAVVGSFGGSVALREWHQKSPPGDPHTFDLTLTLSNHAGGAPTAAFADAVIAEVTRTKPVRSHFTFTLGLTATGSVGLRAVARPTIYARLFGVATAA